MYKKLLGLAIIIILTGAGISYIYLKNNRTPDTDTQILPKELTEDFDPTVNTPIFKILSTNENERKLDLVMIFPEQRAGDKITSLITCDNLDIDATLSNIKQNATESSTFSGLCRDKECGEIYRDCILYLHNEVRK